MRLRLEQPDKEGSHVCDIDAAWRRLQRTQACHFVKHINGSRTNAPAGARGQGLATQVPTVRGGAPIGILPPGW